MLPLIHKNTLISVMRNGSKGEAHGNTMHYLIHKKGWVKVLVPAPIASKRVYDITEDGLKALDPRNDKCCYPIMWSWWTPHVYLLPPEHILLATCPSPTCNQPHPLFVRNLLPQYELHRKMYKRVTCDCGYTCVGCGETWKPDIVMLFNRGHFKRGIDRLLLRVFAHESI